MKYLKFIFENNDIRNIVETKYNDIEDFSKFIIEYNIFLEKFIYENLQIFINEDSNLNNVYTNIRQFVINENLNLYKQITLLETFDPESKSNFIKKHGSKIGAGAAGLVAGTVCTLALKNRLKSSNTNQSPDEIRQHLGAIMASKNSSNPDVKEAQKGIEAGRQTRKASAAAQAAAEQEARIKEYRADAWKEATKPMDRDYAHRIADGVGDTGKYLANETGKWIHWGINKSADLFGSK